MDDTLRLQGHDHGLESHIRTKQLPFQPIKSSEPRASAKIDMLMSISAMAPYKDLSFEELRLQEYAEQTLERLRSALAVEGVDGAVLQEAKTLLATKPLQTAMEQREVAVLKKAIEVAEREVAVDRTVVEVSGCLIWTRATHAWSRCNRWSYSPCRFTNSRL